MWLHNIGFMASLKDFVNTTYQAPNGNNVDFAASGSYSAPSGSNVDFNA